MNLEKFTPDADPEIDAALAKLSESIHNHESKRNYRDLKTEMGFNGTIEFFADNLSNLQLSKGGQTSLFSIDENGARLMEVRGADGELLDEPRIAQQHTNEAARRLKAKQLERHHENETGQLEMSV